MPLVDLHDKRRRPCMIADLLQWSLLHLLYFVVRAEGRFTSAYKGDCPSIHMTRVPLIKSHL